MARYSNVQTDFSGGLVSDYVLGRTDIKRIANSGRKFKNFFPSLQGPAIYRTGFKYYNTLAPEVEDVLTVDVILATSVPYRVVFTPGQIEIFDSNGVSKDILTTTYSAGDIKDLRFSSETGELYIAHGRHRPRKLTADITFVSLGLQSTEANGTNLKLFSTAGYGIDTSFDASEGYISGFAADTSFFEGQKIANDNTRGWEIDPTTGMMSTSGDYKLIRTTSIVAATSGQQVLSKAKFDFGLGTLTNDAERMFTFSLMDIGDFGDQTESGHYGTYPNVSFTAKFSDNKLKLFDQSNMSSALAEVALADIATDVLEAEIKLNVGTTAANTEAVVTLRSITDNTNITHTRTGVPADFYSALLARGVKTFYQSGKLSDGGISPLSIHNVYFRNQTTFGTNTPFELRANAEVQGDDSWTLEDLSFEVEPFLEKEPESNKFNISQNERFIKLESSATDFAPIATDFDSPEVENVSAADTTRDEGTYTVFQKSTTGTGSGATFTIVVDANGACTVTGMTGGNDEYAVGDTIVIDNDDLLGGDAGDFSFDIAVLPGAYSKSWYVEYKVDSNNFLAKAVHAGSSTNYPLEDPTDTIIYVEPVVSVLNIEDNTAQLFLLDNEEATGANDTNALKLDGVEDNQIHLRSDTIVFGSGFVNSWVRVADDRRNNQVVVGQDRSLIRWVKIKEHLGTSDHPVKFYRGTYNNGVYSAGSVYRVYGPLDKTYFMLGPNSAGTIASATAVIQPNGNRTYGFVNALSEQGGVNDPPNNLSTTIGNLSTQKQFDVVACYNNADDNVPKVEEYNPGVNASGNLISPPTSSRITSTPIANDAFINSTEDTFRTEDIDRHIFGRMESGNVFMKIVRFISARQVVVQLISPVPRDQRTLAFENAGNFEAVKLGAWYEENYPRTVAKFEQRRIFAGTYSNPNFIYFSRADDETSFQPTQEDGDVLDTDAITYALSNRNAGVRWMNAAKDLVIGTTGGIYRIVPNQYQYGISPKTIRMELTEEEPCEQQAETVASSVFYPDQSGTRLMEYKYDQTLNSSSSNDVSKLIYPIFLTDSIAQIAYQHTPQPRIWARTVSGKIFCLSYHRQEEFYAWSQQDLGPDAKVLDISILHRGTDTELDQVWIVVKRDGFIHTEALAETDPVQLSSYPMLDSYVELVKPQEGTIDTDVSVRYGAGDTVAVIEDGVYTGEQTLTDGNITLQSADASRVVVGLRYTGELQMMFPTWDARNKPAYGADTARIISVKPFLINSWTYKLGVKDKFESVRVSSVYGNEGGFTGFDKERPVAGSTFGVENVPTIKHEEPYPLTIASLTTKTDLN